MKDATSGSYDSCQKSEIEVLLETEYSTDSDEDFVQDIPNDLVSDETLPLRFREAFSSFINGGSEDATGNCREINTVECDNTVLEYIVDNDEQEQ